jgi:two-component system, response regulator YesN
MSKLLIVDDSASAAAAFAGLLRLEGHDTAIATSGSAAIALAVSTPFDVLLVDLRMPDMSGIEVVRELRARGLQVPAIIVTAFPDLESSFDAAAAGASGYVSGLLLENELSHIVQQAINGQFPVRHPIELAHQSRPRPLPADQRIRRVVHTIETDLRRRWTITALGDSVGLSESRIRHLFSAQIGMSISRFVAERRLQALALLLRTTQDTFKTLAAQVAGTEPRRLRKMFSHRFGMSPSQYRARFWGVRGRAAITEPDSPPK